MNDVTRTSKEMMQKLAAWHSEISTNHMLQLNATKDKIDWASQGQLRERIVFHKEAAEFLQRLTRPDQAPKDQTGWLVESGGNVPRYRTMDASGIQWTDDPNKAIRFARRGDAEMFAAGDEDAWLLVEHMWCSSHELPAEPVAPIVNVHVKNGEIVSHNWFTPGLPDGRHDLFPVPPDPRGQWEPWLTPPPISDDIRQLFNGAVGVQKENRFSFSFETEAEANRAFHYIADLGTLETSQPSHLTKRENATSATFETVLSLIRPQLQRKLGDFDALQILQTVRDEWHSAKSPVDAMDDCEHQWLNSVSTPGTRVCDNCGMRQRITLGE